MRDIARRVIEAIDDAADGQVVEQVGEAITRAAFLYLEPRDEKNRDQFAQCATCMMFTGEHETCTIHGPDEKVVAGGSCGFYVEGDPMPDEAGHEMASVTKEQSGYVERQVRCENCKVFEIDGAACTLYDNLNLMTHTMFKIELDAKVDPKGCCNAQTPKSSGPAPTPEEPEEA